MDYVKKCFEEEQSAFTRYLQVAGFSDQQASKFLSDVTSNIIESAQKTGTFHTITCLLSRNKWKVSEIIDVEVIAQSSTIDVQKAFAGLHAIASVLLQVYSTKSESDVMTTTSISELKQAG